MDSFVGRAVHGKERHARTLSLASAVGAREDERVAADATGRQCLRTSQRACSVTFQATYRGGASFVCLRSGLRASSNQSGDEPEDERLVWGFLQTGS